MAEFITDDGRVFKRNGDKYQERKGGEWQQPISEAQFKRILQASDMKANSMSNIAKTHPQFTEMMWEHANKR